MSTMPDRALWVVELVLGAAAVCLLLAVPAVFPEAAADLLAAVLPTAFFG